MPAPTPSPPATRAVAAIVAQESLRNVSGSAAAAAIQERLAAEGLMPRHLFQIAYAAARLTPGTNLLALYTALGHATSGWRGALAGLAAGSVPSAMCAVGLAWAYERLAGGPAVDAGLEAASIAGIAAIAWAAYTLARPIVLDHRVRAGTLLAALLLFTLVAPVPPLAVIVAGGIAGGLVLR
jgi:chromate transport protein ChrA